MRKLNYPLIVSDFDGTLVNADGTISEENKRAIADYTSAGGVFAISTGRLPSGILPHARELGLKGKVCCCQGAVIVDIQTLEVMLAGRLSTENTAKACQQMQSLGLHVHIYDLWEFYANKSDEFLSVYESLTGTKAKGIFEDLTAFIKEKNFRAYKLLAMVEPEDSERVCRQLSKTPIEGCEVTKSAEFLVEIINKEYSKGTAVEFLANSYGIPLEKTIAVGDQWNDLPMIEKAGIGIAVKNADARLKEAANVVSNYTNEESAIAQIIKEFGFYEEDKE